MIEAAAGLGRELDDVKFTIYGSGSPIATTRLELACTGHQNIHLAGAIPHEIMQSRMNRAGGFVLVSRRESFGLVFAEALLAGCPVVYPKNAAIDGYFDDCSFAVSADPQDRHSIQDSMRLLALEEVSLKRSLAQWQSSGAARMFQRDHIGKSYEDSLLQVVAQQA